MRPPCLALAALATLAIIPGGCIRWGLGEARGYEAARAEVSAQATHDAAQTIDAVIDSWAEHIPRPAARAISAEAAVIRERAIDDAQLARARQADHGYTPAELPLLGSPVDDHMTQTYIGLSTAREIRRTRVSEMPDRLADGAVSMAVRFVPAPVRWGLWLAAIIVPAAAVMIAGGSGLLWLWRATRRWRRTSDDQHDMIADLIERLIAAGVPRDEAYTIAARHPLARARHVERRLTGTAD